MSNQDDWRTKRDARLRPPLMMMMMVETVHKNIELIERTRSYYMVRGVLRTIVKLRYTCHVYIMI